MLLGLTFASKSFSAVFVCKQGLACSSGVLEHSCPAIQEPILEAFCKYLATYDPPLQRPSCIITILVPVALNSQIICTRRNKSGAASQLRKHSYCAPTVKFLLLPPGRAAKCCCMSQEHIQPWKKPEWEEIPLPNHHSMHFPPYYF